MTDPGERAAWRRSLDGFVADLGSGEDCVPLERVLRRHRAVFEAIVATGRTWPQIAQALTEAGARHRRGQPMSAKQLRTVFGRVGKPHPAGRTPATPVSVPSKTPAGRTPESAGAASPLPTRSIGRSASPPTAGIGNATVTARLSEARRARAALAREFEE